MSTKLSVYHMETPDPPDSSDKAVIPETADTAVIRETPVKQHELPHALKLQI